MASTINRGAALVLLIAAACGGSDTTSPPPPPPPPPPTVAEVTVSAPSGPLNIGSTLTLTATAKTAAGATVSGATITWSSDHAAIASVSAAGVVTGLTTGTATIRATSGTVSGTAQVTVQPASLNTIVDSVRAANGLVGMGGVIVSRDGIRAIGIGGTRRVGGLAVTLNDKWHIGSNLKAQTSLFAAITVDAGKIAWTATPAASFPELAGQILPEYANVTLEDLLSMRSGVRNDPPNSAWLGATAKIQRETNATWALGSPQEVPFGTYNYSNPAYVIASAMLERAWGGTFEDLIAEKLWVPAGATNTGWGPTTVAGGTDQPVGHTWNGTGWVACEACDNPPGLSGAGRSHMGLGDFARIIQAYMRADAGLSPIVTQATARKLAVGKTTIPDGGGTMYALGWNFVGSRSWGGDRVVTHAGSNVTNHSVVWVGLDAGIAFIAVTNAADLTGGRTGTALDGLIGRMLQFYTNGR